MRGTGWLLLLVLALGVMGCAASDSPHLPTVGVSLLTKQHPFYQELERGMRRGADRYGYRLQVQSGEFDLASQTYQVENFISMAVDAIVLCPTDSLGVSAAVRGANESSIPVFTADIAAHGRGQIVCHIASDNRQGGELAARYLAQALGGQGEVVIVDHPEVSSVQERTRGFEAELARHPRMILVAKPSAEGQRDKAMSVMENVLQVHPNVRGVFGINDDCALGALAAVEAARRSDITIVGFDATPEARQAILRGSSLKADVVQNPGLIGEKTLEMIQRYLQHETVPSELPIAVNIVDSAALRQDATP